MSLLIKELKKLHSSNPKGYLMKVSEELSELQVALFHRIDGKNSLDDILEEIADVEIQIQKIKAWLKDFSESDMRFVDERLKIVKRKKSNHLKNIIESL